VGACTHWRKAHERETTVTTDYDTDTDRRELDHRQANGIAVTLSWSPRTDALFVTVVDEAAEEAFELVVDAHEALDVFAHPYAYAAFRGIDLVRVAA
jgi:hypothetical protein